MALSFWRFRLQPLLFLGNISIAFFYFAIFAPFFQAWNLAKKSNKTIFVRKNLHFPCFVHKLAM